MTPLAIVFMLIAMAIIWGGLAVAIAFIARHPLDDDGPDDAEPGAAAPAPGSTQPR